MMNHRKTRIELLTRGIKLSEELPYRKTGAGPAGGVYIELDDGEVVNVPVAKDTPLKLEIMNDKGLLKRNEAAVCWVKIIGEPAFYRKRTSDGIEMKKIAVVHGSDCLATTVDQTCIYWRKGLQCKFCGIEYSLMMDETIKRKTKGQLLEVVREALKEDRAKHITLTIGTQGKDKGVSVYHDVVKEIKKQLDIPIHVQIEPVEKKQLQKLKKVGVDTVGIHIETFDDEIRQEICPGKAKTPIQEYIESWTDAVEIFGKNQVSSYIIIGLGEREEKTLEGCEKLCQIGVVPFIVPHFRIKNTELENNPPPSPEKIEGIIERVGEMMQRYGIKPEKNKAGCVRCGCCSLLP